MSEFTHIKKPYKARCIQNTGDNVPDVLAFMAEYGYSPWFPNVDGALYLAHKDDTMDKIAIGLGWWVRVGENNEIKTFSAEEFPLKYQPIEGQE